MSNINAFFSVYIKYKQYKIDSLSKICLNGRTVAINNVNNLVFWDNQDF